MSTEIKIIQCKASYYSSVGHTCTKTCNELIEYQKKFPLTETKIIEFLNSLLKNCYTIVNRTNELKIWIISLRFI
jgi:hypothetical protein